MHRRRDGEKIISDTTKKVKIGQGKQGQSKAPEASVQIVIPKVFGALDRRIQRQAILGHLIHPDPG